MKASDLAERRKQIEESFQRNERERQNFLDKNPQFFNESGISSSEYSESISSSRLQNDSDLFQQKAQKFNTIKGSVNNNSSSGQDRNRRKEYQDNDESIHELIEEHIQNKNDKPLSMDSSSELEYSQSHQMFKKSNNSILKKQHMNNSSGIEEFSFQNNFGLDNSNAKTSNIFNYNNNGNIISSANNLQSVIKPDNQYVNSNNFNDDNKNFDGFLGDNKNNRNNVYSSYNRDSDANQGSQRDSEIGLHRIEEERNSQQNFYSNQYNLNNQTYNYNHQYQLSSSSSRKGTNNNELVTSSHQNQGNKPNLPFFSHNSNNSENINVLNYSNQQFRQPQWSLSQSIYQQQPSIQYAQPGSIHENSYQSSLHLHNNLQNNNSSVANSSSLRPFPISNQQLPSQSGQKDYDFFRMNRDKKEVELPSDMRQQYEKIYEIQTSPNKNENVSKMRQPSPYQQYSQYLHEKQLASQSYQKQLQDQQQSLQNSERRENHFMNSFRSNEPLNVNKNSADKSPSVLDESVRKMTDKFGTQRHKFQEALEIHQRKYSPHSRTQAELDNSLKEELFSSRNFQMGHLQDIYNSYKFDESGSSSPSSSSDESMQQSMAHSVKLKIKKAIDKQKGIKEENSDDEYINKMRKQIKDQKMLQQYISNQSDRSHNSNPQIANQIEEDIDLMKTQIVPQQIVEHREEQDDDGEEEEQDHHQDQQDISQHDSHKGNQEEVDQQFEDENQVNEEDQEQDHQQSEQQFSQGHYSEEGSLQHISQQQIRHKKNTNKHPTLFQIDSQIENNDSNSNYLRSQQKHSSLADIQKYQGIEINPQEWNKYNKQKSEEAQNLIEEQQEDDNIQNPREEEEEQQFQDECHKTQDFNHPSHKNDNQEDDFHELNEEELEQLNELDENQILDAIDELFQAVSHEKDKEEDEERKHQYELIQIRLMNLMPQEQNHESDINEKNKQLQSRIEELMDIQRLFIQILISKQGQQLQRGDSIEDISLQDYEEDIQNLLLQLKKLDQKLQQLMSQRQRRISKSGMFSKKQSQQDSNLNFDLNNESNNNHPDQIFDQSRKNSNAGNSMMELGDFIQKQDEQYIQNEEDFMNRFNDNFQIDHHQGQYEEDHNNQKESQNQSQRASQQVIEQSQVVAENGEGNKEEEEEDEDKLSHKDLLQMLDKKYSLRNSHENLPPIGSKQKIQDSQNDISKSSVENEELEKELQQIRKNAQLKKEIQNMLKDKSDIIEKFKYRLEMRLGDDHEGKGKKSALDDVDLSFQSEMKYEESLKYSSLYKDQNKKQQNTQRKPSDDINSERSAPIMTNNQDDVHEDNEKSELDKTLQDKLKHELFLDLENFRRSDIFKNLHNKKIKEIFQNYARQHLVNQIREMCRAMSVMSNAKILYQKKQDNLKQNCFNVIKWYSDYSKVKNNRKFQIEQNMKVKNMETKSIAFAKIKKFCAQHRKWLEAIHENNKMMKCYKVITEWKKIVNYKSMKRQADLYYKNTLFQKFKNNINERKNSVDVRALIHYSNKLQNQYFALFCQTAKDLRRKRIGINQKVNKINKELLGVTFSEWRKYAHAKKQEKNDYISIQICIKDTISKPKMQPNQTLQEYKKTPITAQKTIKVIMPPDSAFKS